MNKKLILLTFSIMFLLAVTPCFSAPKVEVPYTAFNSATATTYNYQLTKYDFKVTIQANLTWGSSKTGLVRFIDSTNSSNYLDVELTDSLTVTLKDEDATTLVSATTFKNYTYIIIKQSSVSLWTDYESNKATKTHSGFYVTAFNCSGETGCATDGNLFVTMESLTSFEIINELIPTIITLAVMGMIIKFMDRMITKSY